MWSGENVARRVTTSLPTQEKWNNFRPRWESILRPLECFGSSTVEVHVHQISKLSLGHQRNLKCSHDFYRVLVLRTRVKIIFVVLLSPMFPLKAQISYYWDRINAENGVLHNIAIPSCACELATRYPSCVSPWLFAHSKQVDFKINKELVALLILQTQLSSELLKGHGNIFSFGIFDI